MKQVQKKEVELLVDDHNGIYTPQVFCQKYLNYIVNKEQLKDDIDICLRGADDNDYWDAWDNLLNNIEFTNDNGEKYTVGYLEDSGDLWAIPEGYEYPED